MDSASTMMLEHDSSNRSTIQAIATTWPPRWQNARGGPLIRSGSYTNYEIEQDEQTFRVKVIPTSLLSFLFGFFILAVVIGIAIWLDRGRRPVVIGSAMAVCGLTAVGIMAVVDRWYEQLGDYLTADRFVGTVKLPRYEATVELSRVIAVQRVMGRTQHGHYHTDTHLLVEADDGTILRYFVKRSLSDEHASQLAVYLDVDLFEISCEKPFLLDSDCKSPA